MAQYGFPPETAINANPERKPMNKTFIIPALLLAMVGFTAQAAEPAKAESDAKSMLPADLGPMKYDAGGVLKCSVDSAAYDLACGFRIVRKPGGAAEIWIANPTHSDEVRYRVLYFAEGEFTTRDDAKLDYGRDSDNWLMKANGNEFYRIPDAVITGG